MVDARYIIIVLIMIIVGFVIHKWPRYGAPVTLALAAAALAYAILFPTW